MKKPNCCLLLIFIVFLGSHMKVFAQTRMYPDLAVTITTKIPGTDSISDYAVYFNYGSRGNVYCKYYVRHNLRIYRDGDADANIILTDVADSRLDTFYHELPVGPSSNHRYGLRYQEYSHTVYSCNEYSWSGFKKNDQGIWEPYATPSVTERDNLWNSGRYSVTIYANTAPIKSPGNVTASDKEYFNRIVLNWTRATKIPNEIHKYKIWRGTTNNPSAATCVGEVAGTIRTWTDSTTVPNDAYYYWVTTYFTLNTNLITNFPVYESTRTTQNAVIGRTKTITVKASDGEFSNSVRVEWEDLSSYFENIRIERSIPNSTGKTEVAILNKYAKSFNDDGVNLIPGYTYTYYVTPIRSPLTFSSHSDQGYMKSNGVISGTIKSVQGSGVDSVLVCAKLRTVIPAGAIAKPSQGYCTYTGIDGYFEIPNIYYYSQADFMIIPYKAGHVLIHDFNPDSVKRTLTQNSPSISGLNFTDESVFTVGGKVVFPTSSTLVECGVPGVEMLINGQKTGLFTNASGVWSYTIQNEGTYTFKPVFKHHRFQNAQGQSQSSILINDNVPNINFTDMETDSIMVKVQSGCGTPVATRVNVQVTSPNNCYNQQFYTNAQGLLTLRNLPARKYDLQVTALDPVNSNIMNQIGYKPITVDLTVRDTALVVTTRDSISITPADTIYFPNGTFQIIPADTVITTVNDSTLEVVIPKAEFIYHSPLNVSVDFRESGAEVVCENRYVLMEQYDPYKLYFNVKETLGNCGVTEGVLRIYDFVSDRGTVAVDVPVKNGLAMYTIKAGIPEIAVSPTHNHEKLLYVMPRIGFLESPPISYWILVTGRKSQAPSFFTKSPKFPLLVIHDPPADSSYAFVEKGATFTNFYRHELLKGGEGGGYMDGTFGGGTKEWKMGAAVKFQITGGKDSISRDGVQTSLTFNERIETSRQSDFIGHEGDVFVGASFNEEFAFADELSFNKATCTPELKIVPSINLAGFNTTFIYTEKHIRNTLIPTLRSLFDATVAGRDSSQLTEEEQWQAGELYCEFMNWEDVLARNDSNRGIKATPLDPPKNISFSAGPSITEEFTTDTLTSISGEYRILFNSQFSLGFKAKVEMGFWMELDVGAIGKYRISDNTHTGSDTTYRRKVGYVLADRDVGDYFSVDIKRDEAYGVPAFQLKSGTSSCPYEPGSQPRDDAEINIYPPEITNVPIGGVANFTASLVNASQSRELRSYAVKVITNTNPNGAVVKLGGTQINNTPVIYNLNFNQTTNIALSVEKGPYASHYDNIGIVMYPPCRLEKATSDTSWISVSFQTVCSDVWLKFPENGWLVNQSSNNKLNVTLTGYDPWDPRLQSITLEYKKDGGVWTDGITIPKDSLKQVFYDFIFDVTALQDGAYKLRTRAFCGAENSPSYSPERSGNIDRISINPYGYPSPSDQILSQGEEISVTFDKNLNCDLSTATIKLFLEDSTLIPMTPQCYGNKIILMPQINLFDLEWIGFRFYALVKGVRDLSGNVQKYPITWNFTNGMGGGPSGICAVNCPGDILVSSEPGFCGAQVFYPDILPAKCITVDNTLVRTSGLPSGYFFPVGITTNTYLNTIWSGYTHTCTFQVTVIDNESPSLSDLSASYDATWPPNHKMIPVTVSYTVTDNCGLTDIEITVSGSETGVKNGSGNTPVDIVVQDEHHIFLRAERTGPGTGRTYTISVKCTDEAGNISLKTASLYIPHDKGKLKSVELAGYSDLDPGKQAALQTINNNESLNEPFIANVWPNPSNNGFNLEVKSSFNENIDVRLSDILGRMISNLNVTAMQPVSFGEKLEPGVYFISIRQGNYSKNIKVIKQ